MVVSSVERFAPTDTELRAAEREAASIPAAPEPLQIRLNADLVASDLIDDLREILTAYPGDAEVVLALEGSSGTRRLRLGNGYRVMRTAGLHAELAQQLGAALLPAAPGNAAAAA